MILDLKVTDSDATDDETLDIEVASEEFSFKALAGLDEDMSRISMTTNQIFVTNVRKNNAEVESVLSTIKQRHTAGESTPVLASHLDSLGLRDAVLALALKS